MISNVNMQRGALGDDNKVRKEDLKVWISQSIKKLAPSTAKRETL